MVYSQRWLAVLSAVAALFCLATTAQAVVVRGSVSTAGADPKPIHGATVIVGYFDGKTWRYSAPTPADDQGNFSVTVQEYPKGAGGIPPNDVSVYAYAPGYSLAEESAKVDVHTALHLTTEQTIHGKVLDDAGKPVAGVTISVTTEFMASGSNHINFTMPPGLGKPFVVTSDAQGQWQVGGLLRNSPAVDASGDPTAAVALNVNDPRFVASSLYVGLGDSKELTLHVRAGGTITGRVVDESGKPEVGVIVSAANSAQRTFNIGVQSDSSFASGNTGPDGEFTLPCLSKGNYAVSIGNMNSHGEAVPLVAVAATNIAVTERKTTALASPLVLKPGAMIEGTVVSKETNKPIPGVMIYTYGPQNPRNNYGGWSTSGETDAEGKFSVRVAEGDSEVHIGSRIEGFTYFDPALPVTVHDGETKTIAPIQLSPTRHVLLTVKDESGKPVADLPLIIQQPNLSGYQWDDAAHTDAQGVWDSNRQNQPELSADNTQPWQIKVPSGWDVVSPASLTLPVDAPVAVVVRKADLSTHPRGRVVTPDGKPIAGANVFSFSYFKDGDNQRDYQNENVDTDSDGRFLLTPLRPGVIAQIGINKGDYRRAHNEAIDSLLHMPTGGAQPDLGNLVMIPLMSSISGSVVDAAGKPAVGVWVWSHDGDQRSLTRTDAHGLFTIQHLPANGPVVIHAASKALNTLYTAVDRGKAAIQLPAPVHSTDASVIAYNRRRGLMLLTELAHEAAPAQGPRDDGDGKDTLADMMASLDVDIAVHVGTPASGIIDEKVVSGILENAVQNDPVKARALFLAHRDSWTNTDTIFYRNIDMAMAFANRDPVFANECYHAAAKLIGESISADSVWNLTNLTKAAFLLNAPDADDWAKRAIAAAAKANGAAGNTDDAVATVTGSAAEGDGVRAASLITGMSPDKRSAAASQILYGMASQQPLETKKLLDGWVADGTINPANNQINWQISQTSVRLSKALSAHDAVAAMAVANKAPENIRWEATLWAASAETDPAARVALYRQVIDAGNPWDGIKRLSECIYFANRTHDTALSGELQDKLANSMLNDIGIFNGNATESAARITMILCNQRPDVCRLLLEMAIHQATDFNPNNDNEMWTLRQPIQAMALIDVDRAIQIAEAVHGNDGAAKSKVEIVRALLTPPAKWRDLVGDPLY